MCLVRDQIAAISSCFNEIKDMSQNIFFEKLLLSQKGIICMLKT